MPVGDALLLASNQEISGGLDKKHVVGRRMNKRIEVGSRRDRGEILGIGSVLSPDEESGSGLHSQRNTAFTRSDLKLKSGLA